jgi:predicted nucleotidyltransferase
MSNEHATAMLERTTTAIETNLCGKLVGLYVYGSFVCGDFHAARSDLDLLAVLSSGVTPEELERLRAMHDDLVARSPEWNDRIEVAYVPMHALETFRTQRSVIARVSPGEPLHLAEAGRESLLNLYMARGSGRTLFGPPPQHVIPPIDKTEFLAVVREHVVAWKEWVDRMRHPGGQAYAVLTLCRARYALTLGEQVSKRRAAAWVSAELSAWSELISWALAWWYDGGAQTPDQDRFADVQRFVSDLVERFV